MRMNTMADVDERRFLFSLMVVTGSALAVSDQFDTATEECLEVYRNKELIELNKAGFCAQPLSRDVKSKDSSRWIGKLPCGDWIVAFSTVKMQRTNTASISGKNWASKREKREMCATSGHIRTWALWKAPML